MRPPCAILTSLLCGMVASCATYDDAQVYGAFYRVSPADLRAAVAAAQEAHGQRPLKAYSFLVNSADEIEVHYTSETTGPAYVAKRRNGKWRIEERTLVFRDYIGL